MKKLQILVLVLLIIFVPGKVMAFAGGMTVSCTPASAKAGSTIDCNISGSADEAITKIVAEVAFGSNLSKESYTKNSAWNTGQLELLSEKYQLINEATSGIVDSFDIGTLRLKVSNDIQSGNLTVNFNNIQYFDTANNAHSVTDVQTIITIVPEVKKGLKSLSVTGGELKPFFSTTVYDYSLSINSNTFSIMAEASNAGDSVVVTDGENNTTLDKNNINFVSNGADSATMLIKVTVGNGGEGNVYQIIVSKVGSTEYNNELKTLTVGEKNIPLSKGKYEYEVVLDNVTSYLVQASLYDSENFMIDQINGGEGSYNGEVNIPIIIKPKNNNLGFVGSTYAITVKKKGSIPTNNKPSGNSNQQIKNPQTGNISIFAISLILIASLIVSLNLYKKNINYFG